MTDVITTAIPGNAVNKGCAVIGVPKGYISRCPDNISSLNTAGVESKYTNRFDDYRYYHNQNSFGFSSGFSSGFNI